MKHRAGLRLLGEVTTALGLGLDLDHPGHVIVSSLSRRRHTMRISLACVVLLLGVVACVSDPGPDPVQDATRVSSEVRVDPVADTAASDLAPTADGSMAAAAVPEELQLITPRVACNKANEGCLVPNQCRAVHGHPVAGTCPSGKQ